ncbi:hypothetical protein KM043_005539 [Ampulex compressa]|nr:hypothetical protein KM043_005539 [Ampulex compressa]
MFSHETQTGPPVPEFSGILEPRPENSTSQPAKLNPASGEMFPALARSGLSMQAPDRRNLITEYLLHR